MLRIMKDSSYMAPIQEESNSKRHNLELNKFGVKMFDVESGRNMNTNEDNMCQVTTPSPLRNRNGERDDTGFPDPIDVLEGGDSSPLLQLR